MIRKAIMMIVVIGLLLGLYRAVDGDLIMVFDQVLFIVTSAINFVASIVTPVWEAIFT